MSGSQNCTRANRTVNPRSDIESKTPSRMTTLALPALPALEDGNAKSNEIACRDGKLDFQKSDRQ
jgi:hypothetical protein